MGDRDADKLSPRLVERLEMVDRVTPIEVVVELRPLDPGALPVGSRHERVAALREAFQRELAPVAERIEAAGGSVLETAWLNQTVRSRIPAGQLGRVADDDAVVTIDLARPIHPA
jgi:hypothetical protein